MVIFCKSYSKDIFRAHRLVKSVAKFNTDNIPFYISMPKDDLNLFREHLDSYPVAFITDEEIIEVSLGEMGCGPGDVLPEVPVHLMQQIVKAEFWRWGQCKNYLVIDSDSYFVRPFSMNDFIHEGSVPYTVMHEGKDFLQFATRHNMKKVVQSYIELRRTFKTIFNRRGPFFDFGPTPVIWSSSVWEGLNNDYATPQNSNIFEMICKHPCELLWYGEYLLHAKPFPIIPREPLFKVYHYKEQFEEGQRIGENDEVIAQNFLGAVIQSNWDRSLDQASGERSFISRIFNKKKRLSNLFEKKL